MPNGAESEKNLFIRIQIWICLNRGLLLFDPRPPNLIKVYLLLFETSC